MASVVTDHGRRRQNGDAMRYWREKRDLSQTYVAQKLGFTQSHLSKLESCDDNARMATLTLLADILDVPVSELLRDPVDGKAA